MKRFLVLSLALTVCSAEARAADPCPAIANVNSLLKPGAHVVLGEVHGNVETPRFAASLACHAARLGPVRVGLEIPVEEQPRLDAYLASGDRATLLKGPFWTDEYQDGRRSQGMVALLDSVRALREHHADVKVVAFDGPGADRERAMAERLAAAFAAAPKAMFVVLVGNLHARKTPGSFKRQFMTARLVERGLAVTSLNARYGEGTSWVCNGARASSCAPNTFGDGPARAPAITLARSNDAAYDGIFDVGVPTFSPPAAVSLTPAQKTRVASLELLQQAKREYASHQYASCGARYSELAKRDAGLRADAGYNAACCFALAGASDQAFAALADAVDGGFSDGDSAQTDQDLASLHNDARWRSLIDRMRHGKPGTSINQSLRSTLVKMAEDDQSENELAMKGKPVVAHVQERIQLLKQIIGEYGWPGASLAGADGAEAAWLIAQHADTDLAFQKECLSLVEKAHAAGEATGMQLAYLTDRVLSAEGRPQLYGTQGAPQYSPREKAEVDARRKKLGLPSIDEMARAKAKAYQQIEGRR